MASSRFGEYRVSVEYNSEQCDISCDEPYGDVIEDTYFAASTTPTVTYTFTPKTEYVISDIAVSGINNCTYEIIDGNKVKITASNPVVSGKARGYITITVTTQVDIKDLSSLFTGIANAIRTKDGTTAAIPATGFPSRISAIQTGTDTSDASASAADILSGKTAYVKGAKVTGSMATVTQATPSISVSSGGLITASAEQSAGYVAAGTKTATKQLTTQAAATITPGTAAKTAVAAYRYTTGEVKVAGDANLVAQNIKKGVSLFGVAGSYEGAAWPVPATVTIGTQQSTSGIALLAAPSYGNDVNVECTYYDFDTQRYVQQADVTNVHVAPMQIVCAIGSIIRILSTSDAVQLVGAILVPELTTGSYRMYLITSDNAVIIYPNP